MGSSPLLGRTHELGTLRRAFDRAQASLVRVAGLPGVGKTRLVRRAAADFRSLYHRVPPLPEADQRMALARTLAEQAGDGRTSSTSAGGPPSWDDLFTALVAAVPEGCPLVLVVDDAHRWEESRARVAPALEAALAEARSRAQALHVALVSPELPAVPASDEPSALDLTLRPLTFRAAAAFLPGASVRERLCAHAVFGGVPGHLARVDAEASLGANVRRLVLDGNGALADAPLALLERLFQTPSRYAAVLTALADGEGSWGTVQSGVSDLSAGGQAAPYLKRLEEVGLVEARRSLDASPRTRSHRYRIRDPFVAFWFRFVLPSRHLLHEGIGERLWTDVIRPGLPPHVASILPEVCRDFMANDAIEVLGSNAREVGSLWGAGYDIPVAGLLTSGAAYYGLPVEAGSEADTTALDRLDAQIRETRYGFGRERRLRILFVDGEPSLPLQREAARRDDVIVVGPDALGGSDGSYTSRFRT